LTKFRRKFTKYFIDISVGLNDDGKSGAAIDVSLSVLLSVSVHEEIESEREATEIAEKQGQKERRQGPDGRSEGGELPPR
jgi:hypothetical protein